MTLLKLTCVPVGEAPNHCCHHDPIKGAVTSDPADQELGVRCGFAKRGFLFN